MQPDNMNSEQPIPAPKTKNKSIPLIIILAILALAGIGFGVYGMFFRPVETVEKIVEKEVVDENDAVVKEVIDKIVVAIEAKNHRIFSKTYDEVMPRYKSDKMKVYTSLDKSYGGFVYGPIMGDAPDYGETIKSELQKNGFKKHEYFTFFGDTQYINDEIGVVCLITGSAPYDMGCSHISWISNEKIALINQLADAGADSETINASIDDIVDSTKKPYQRLTAGGSNHAMLFYRTSPDAEWKFFRGTQDFVPCSEYNTDDIKKAFFGEPCADAEGNESTVSL